MRFNLSRKIFVVYGLLLSFSLIQGIALYSVVEQLRSYSALKELLIEFKFQIHALENLKDKIDLTVNYGHDPSDAQHQNEHQHEPFEDEYTKTQDILSRLTRSNQKHILDFSNQFDDTATFLAHYRRAYFELHNLIHKEQLIHSQATQTLTGVRRRFSILGPEASEQLFFLLLDNFAIESNILLDHNIKNLPPLKEMKEVITLLTNDQETLTILQNVINLTEDDYLNSLEILDRQTFLSDSAAHLVEFCDSATASLTEQVLHYQAQLKRYLTIMIIASVFLSLLLFWLSRKYFKKFLGSQKDAITSIANGKYDYQLPALPQDELGDLAIFMKDMANNLKQSSEEVRRSEENIRLLLNSAAEAIYGLDMEGRCTFCNNSFLRFTGYEREEELIGKKIHNLIHHSRLDGNTYPWDECFAHQGFMEGKQTHSDNEVFWRRDGSSFFAECWSHPIIQNDKVTGAVVTLLDITERRNALQALRNSEELYRDLIENIDLGITMIDKNHTIIMTNSAQGRMFDRDALSFNGQKCFREFEKREQICSHCPGIAAMNTGETQEVLAQGAKDDGTNFSVRIKAFPVFREKKEAFGFIEVVEDVTEKLQAEQELAAEKEQLSVTLRSIGDGVITTDIEGRVVLINKVAEELCGWSQTEAQGRPLDEVFQIINEATGEACESPVEKVLSTGQVIALANHTALIARDGRQHSIADSGAAIRDQKSEIIGVVLVFRDVTEENIREKELLKGKKLESIGLLAGGIAHDFNNILSAILGNINLVRHIVDPGEQKAHTYLEEAEKASIRAQNLTHQLLTFSKGGEPVKQAASILDIIKDSTTFILRGSDIKYESETPEGLWPVVVDPGQISQVIQNIVLNARHAMPGGGTLHISVCNVSRDSEKPLILSTNKDYVMVTIADSGVGIPASAIDNIFDPYFTTKQEGSGLGLSICHSIITKHSGYISVQSEQGRGTVFTIYLPAANTTENVQKTEYQEKVLAKKNLSVLIMDDDKQIRTIAEAMLSHLGCRTLQASDGEEAIELYRASLENEQPIDAVIMDLTIPGGMGGKKAITEILKLDPGVRAIVSSGYSNDPIMANYQDHGFSAVIIKPYQLKELAAALDNALKK